MMTQSTWDFGGPQRPLLSLMGSATRLRFLSDLRGAGLWEASSPPGPYDGGQWGQGQDTVGASSNIV